MTRTPLRAPVSEAGASRPRTSGPTGQPPLAPDAVLRRAARDVVTAYRNDAGDAINQQEVETTTNALVAMVLAGMRGEPLEHNRTTVLPLVRRLLGQLRGAVVAGWSDGAAPDAGTMLPFLRAFEAVRMAIEPEWSEYFSHRLHDRDAYELVVEIAHDLRSPLTSILFLAETLQKGQSGPVSALQRRQLGLIYGAALGLNAVASDVLELARGGDRLMDAEPSPFSVTEMMDAVEEIVRPIAEEKGLAITTSHPVSDHRLGHPLALSRVLLNLTTNALKFTDQGEVTITAEPRGLRRVEFAVRDTGRGIADGAMETLYQPFRRTPARPGEYCFSGTGLGLGICRRLVEAMNSQLHVETRPDWGTRFSFEIELPPASHL